MKHLLTATLLIAYPFALIATAKTSVFEDKKIPHCIKSKGVTHVFTSPIGDVIKGKSTKDVVIECVDGKLDKVKGVYNEW